MLQEESSAVQEGRFTVFQLFPIKKTDFIDNALTWKTQLALVSM